MTVPQPSQNTDHGKEHVGAVFGASMFWLYLLMGVFAIVLLTQSLLIVGPQEVGIIYRFGALREVVENGTYWRWPYPIETARKISFGKEMSLRTNAFRQGLPPEALFDPPETLDPRQYAFLVTADGAIIHMDNCILTYTVDIADKAALVRLFADYPDQKDFLGTLTETGYRATLRQLLEQSAVRAAATLTTEEILHQPARFHDAILSHLRAQSARLNLGVNCSKITAELLLPAQVVQAYQKASNVRSAEQKQLADARREAARLKSEGESAAARIRADALSEKARRSAETQTMVKRFNDYLPAYRADPAGIRALLSDEARRRVFGAAEERYFIDDLQSLNINLSRFKEKPQEGK